MPDTTPLLSLPLIMPSQAQKHLTHNEAISRLDSLVQLSVKSRTQSAAPGSGVEGDRFLLPDNPTGLWAGKPAGHLAMLQNGAWVFEEPKAGWLAWVQDEQKIVAFEGEWILAQTPPDFQNLPSIGIGATADATNRLSTASDATLFSHSGHGHQLKTNKASTTETGSILFQSNWSGRAEFGLIGNDALSLKVSADGSTFTTALTFDAETGTAHFPNGLTGASPAEFGTGPLVTSDYVGARGMDLVTNGTGQLGNTYNFPAEFSYDEMITPNLPGSFRFQGYSSSAIVIEEDVAVDPNRAYRTSCYLRQENVAGSWSAFSSGCRHLQYVGVLCLDADRNPISATNHMRFRQGDLDSRTTLAQPLSPGDTVVHLASTSGWNTSSAHAYNRGIILFGYQNSKGYQYSDYSRIVGHDLFELGAIDASSNTIALKAPWPDSLKNPNDPSGIWPTGTALANSSSDGSYKYTTMAGVVPEAGKWFRAEGFIGDIDKSGTNQTQNFAPGTAFVKIMWLANYSNRSGGWTGYPDTGSSHSVWFAGISMFPDPTIKISKNTTGATSGSYKLQVIASDPVTNQLSLQNVLPKLSEL